MNIGSIVSTVQAEPLEIGESVPVIADWPEKLKYEVLVNEEITPEIKEDIFA